VGQSFFAPAPEFRLCERRRRKCRVASNRFSWYNDRYLVNTMAGYSICKGSSGIMGETLFTIAIIVVVVILLISGKGGG